MKQSEAWLLQAASDFAAAAAVFDKADASTYCQSIAKYQQTVEKSVKGMIAALNEQEICSLPISHNHELTHEIKSLNSLRRTGLKFYDKNLVDKINATLNKRKTQVEWLSDFAPTGPKNRTYSKNTEYPFNAASPDSWAAPAGVGSFSVADVTTAYNLAQKLHKQANDVITSLLRRR
jgi:HEPN domain-containing protein